MYKQKRIFVDLYMEHLYKIWTLEKVLVCCYLLFLKRKKRKLIPAVSNHETHK